MARIEVILFEDGEGPVQYKSVGAFLITRNADFLLDSVCLDTEDYSCDLELIESFCNRFERIAKADDIQIEFNEEVNQLIIELNCEIDRIDEEKEIENEKTWKRCQN